MHSLTEDFACLEESNFVSDTKFGAHFARSPNDYSLFHNSCFVDDYGNHKLYTHTFNAKNSLEYKKSHSNYKIKEDKKKNKREHVYHVLFLILCKVAASKLNYILN